jgi:hypothetical protein
MTLIVFTLLYNFLYSCHNWNVHIEILLDMLQSVKSTFTIHPLDIPEFFFRTSAFFYVMASVQSFLSVVRFSELFFKALYLRVSNTFQYESFHSYSTSRGDSMYPSPLMMQIAVACVRATHLSGVYISLCYKMSCIFTWPIPIYWKLFYSTCHSLQIDV